MEKTFTYRNGVLFFIAFWVSCLGLVFSLTALRASLVDHLMTVRMANGAVVTSGPLAWIPIFLPALSVPIGLWLFLFAANSKVVLDSDGVRVYNWSRRLTFEARWEEILSISRARDSRGGYSIAIETKDHTEMITSSLVGMDDLVKFLSDHVGVDVPTPDREVVGAKSA